MEELLTVYICVNTFEKVWMLADLHAKSGRPSVDYHVCL